MCRRPPRRWCSTSPTAAATLVQQIDLGRAIRGHWRASPGTASSERVGQAPAGTYTLSAQYAGADQNQHGGDHAGQRHRRERQHGCRIDRTDVERGRRRQRAVQQRPADFQLTNSGVQQCHRSALLYRALPRPAPISTSYREQHREREHHRLQGARAPNSPTCMPPARSTSISPRSARARAWMRPRSNSRRATSPRPPSNLDLAISGDGFFTLKDASGIGVYAQRPVLAGQERQCGERHRPVAAGLSADRQRRLSTPAPLTDLNLQTAQSAPQRDHLRQGDPESAGKLARRRRWPFNPDEPGHLQPVDLDHGVRLARHGVHRRPSTSRRPRPRISGPST